MIVKVTNKGVYLSFPIDMLRYDQCTPATTQDSGKIATSIRGYGGKKEFEIELIYLRGRKPTIERWNSFGWEVLQ